MSSTAATEPSPSDLELTTRVVGLLESLLLRGTALLSVIDQAKPLSPGAMSAVAAYGGWARDVLGRTHLGLDDAACAQLAAAVGVSVETSVPEQTLGLIDAARRALDRLAVLLQGQALDVAQQAAVYYSTRAATLTLADVAEKVGGPGPTSGEAPHARLRISGDQEGVS